MAFEAIFMDIVQIIIYVIVGAALVGVAGGGYLILRREFLYAYHVLVIDLSATGQFRLLADKGGVFVDRKTKNKLFFLKKQKTGLSPDRIPFVLYNKTKAVFVLKRGAKSFSYITPKLTDKIITKKVPVLDDNGLPTFDEEKNQIFTTQEFKDNCLDFDVGDEDVNWALNTYDRNKQIFAQTTIMQLMPFIALAFVGIIIAVIFIYFFKELGVLVEMSANFKDAATELAKGQLGTIVVAGG